MIFFFLPSAAASVSASVASPIEIVPVEVPPTVEFPPTATPVFASPKVITPVPAALTVPFRLIALGAVATTPPVKATVSPPSPKVSVPLLLNVVVPAIVFVPPVIETL